MNRVFAIIAASERVSAGGNGSGEITFTAPNSSARPLRGQLRVRLLGSTRRERLSIAGRQTETSATKSGDWITCGSRYSNKFRYLALPQQL
jgi:hypothetical protein